jgi:hypothetical protein
MSQDLRDKIRNIIRVFLYSDPPPPVELPEKL